MLEFLLIGGAAALLLAPKKEEAKFPTDAKLKETVLKLLSGSVQAAQKQQNGTLNFPPVTFPMAPDAAQKVFTEKFRNDIVAELHKKHPDILTRQTAAGTFPRKIELTIAPVIISGKKIGDLTTIKNNIDKNNIYLRLTEHPVEHKGSEAQLSAVEPRPTLSVEPPVETLVKPAVPLAEIQPEVPTETKLKDTVVRLLSESVQKAEKEFDGRLSFPSAKFPMPPDVAERVFTEKLRDDIVAELHRMHPTILSYQTATGRVPRKIKLYVRPILIIGPAVVGWRPSEEAIEFTRKNVHLQLVDRTEIQKPKDTATQPKDTATRLKDTVLKLLSESVQKAQKQPDGRLKFPPVTFPMSPSAATRVFTKTFRQDIVAKLHKKHPDILMRQTATGKIPRRIEFIIHPIKTVRKKTGAVETRRLHTDQKNVYLLLIEHPLRRRRPPRYRPWRPMPVYPA